MWFCEFLKLDSSLVRQTHHAAARLEGILQQHGFVRLIGRAAGSQGDRLGSHFGGAAGAEAEGDDDREKRDS